MRKINNKNERIKRKFFTRLKEAEGCCESTINNIDNAILLYEDFTKQYDFSTFSENKAMNFKKWLRERQHRGKNIALTTYNTYLRHLRKFFIWLSGEAGYKSKVTSDKIAYLRISKKEERMAMQSPPRNYPALEYVLNLTDSIEIITEIDRRDRALIAFTLLTGMRDKAISTLPIACLNENELIINQDPQSGVETKFSKCIATTIFKFDEVLLNYFLDWVKHLKAKGFGSQAPIFPRSKRNKAENNLSFDNATKVEPVFWKGTGRIREIFKTRSKSAGLPYFPPHTFRHLAVELALKACKTGDQIKAISQNFGHENVVTTMYSYANYDDYKLNQVIKSMDFSGKDEKEKEKQVRDITKIVLAQMD